MRGLFFAGLTLALGGLAASTFAEEVQWRPTGAKAPGVQQSSANFRPAGSGTAVPGNDVKFTPVSYTSVPDSEPVFRAKNEGTKGGQPLPAGPELDKIQPPPIPGTKPEVAPMPKPLPNDGKPNAQGGQVIQTLPPGTIIYDNQTGAPITTLPGQSVQYGDMVGSPDWSCCGEGGGWCGLKKGWRGCMDCFNGWCGDCGDNCRLPRIWGRVEYLNWNISDADSPPLVTRTDFNRAQLTALGGTIVPGAIGQPGTVIAFGGEDALQTPNFSGGRFTLGLGLGQDWGLETTYFFLGSQTQSTAFASNAVGFPSFYTPFIVAETGQPSSRFVAFASNTPLLDPVAGNIRIDFTSQLWGLEANIRKPWHCECNHKLDCLVGFRFVELRESLNIIRNTACAPDPAQFCSVFDSFSTRNDFFGGQVGLDYEYHHGRWIFGVMGKVAIGAMHQTAQVNGWNLGPGNIMPLGVVGGDLTRQSNIGKYSRETFAVVPEVGLKMGYQLTDHVSAFVGYNVLYLSQVARPGDQIDLNIDTPGVPPNTGRPAFQFRGTDFFAWGVNAGLECRY